MKNFKKIWQLLSKKQQRSMLVLFIFMLVGMGLETLGIGLIVPAMILMMQSDLATKFPEVQPLLDVIGNPTQEKLIILSMLLLLSVYVIKTFFLAFLFWKQTSFASLVTIDLSQRLFTIYLHQPYSFHLQRNSAQLIHNITALVGQTAKSFTLSLLLLSEIMVLLGVSILLFMVEPIGTLAVLLIFGAVAWLFSFMSRNRILEWGSTYNHHEGLRLQRIQEGLGGAKDVKILGRESSFLKQYLYHNKSSNEALKYQTVLQSMPRLLFELMAVLSLASIVFVMLVQDKTVEIIIPTLGLFAAAAFRMMPSINRILGAVQGIRFSLPMVEKLYEEFNTTQLQNNFSSDKAMEFKEVVKINDISYKYPSSDTWALEKISCRVAQGAFVGFIGSSGAGKSTLVDIILGLLQPLKGSISIDGINMLESIRSWQNEVGYVPQSIFLTDDTLMRNIAFGIPNNKIDKKMVWKALESAQLKEFVEELPEGLDTVVGERGVRLSGGQRQRIGIARALYHDPSVLVLDEATSSLDTATEKGVMDAVRDLKGKKTLIIITHRLSTVEGCDYLYRLEKGKIVDEGKAVDVIEDILQ